MELTLRYILDNAPRELTEMTMRAVQRMAYWFPYSDFLSPPVLHHKEAADLVVCYVDLLDEQDRLMAAGYLGA